MLAIEFFTLKIQINQLRDPVCGNLVSLLVNPDSDSRFSPEIAV